MYQEKDKEKLQELAIYFSEYVVNEDRIYHEAAKSLKIRDSFLWILYALEFYEEPLSFTELVKKTGLTKQTCYSAVQKMLEEKLIGTDENKRRCKYFLLEKGQILAKETAGKIQKAEIAALKTLSEEELDSMYKTSFKFFKALEQEFSKLKGE